MPYYVRPSEAGIVEHMKAVADASSVPIVLYNIPYRTGRGLGAASLLELAAHPNIAGVKQAVGALDADTLASPGGSAARLRRARRRGCDPVPDRVHGRRRARSRPRPMCAPSAFVAMIECGLAGKLDDGRAHAEALLPVVRAGFAEPNPAVFKGVLHAQGRIATPDLRLPMTNASSAVVEAALGAIERASH